MGCHTRVTQAVSRMNRRPGRRLPVLPRKLKRLEESCEADWMSCLQDPFAPALITYP